MKFTEFLSEARTVAGDAAAKRGLQHVGHGYYADRSGNIVAKSEKGQRLVAVDKSEAQAAQAGVEQGDQEDAHLTSGEGLGTVAITFGRFNPPTIGHEKLLDAVAKEGVDSYRIYPSRTVDPKKNPLEPEIKVKFMNEMYPSHSDAIVNDSGMSNIFNVMVALQDEGYTGVTLVVGSDRVSEFKSLLEKYNGQAYEFEELNVVSAGDRDPDAEGVEGMSASKMRAFAASGDLESFTEGVPGGNAAIAKRLMNEVRKGMGIAEEEQVAAEMWEIAPKLAQQDLREAYFQKDVFQIGQLVEHMDTGVRGTVKVRGANYVIYETAEGYVFKSWLQHIAEVSEISEGEKRLPLVKMNNKAASLEKDGSKKAMERRKKIGTVMYGDAVLRLTRKEEKEEHKSADDGSGNDWKVGTDTYRKAVQEMTPGQSVKKFSDFRKSK